MNRRGELSQRQSSFAQSNRVRDGGRSKRGPVLVEDDGKDHQIVDPDRGLSPGFRQPQPFRSTQVTNSKIRFVVNTAITTYTWTAADFLRLHSFSTAANTGYGIARSIEFKYIEIWEPFQGTGMTTSVAGVSFYGTGATNTGTNDERFASSASPDYPGHLLSKPPKGTLIGAWQNVASSLTMFDIKNLSVGAFVDVCFNYLSGENQTASNLGSYIITAASAGLVGVHPPTTSLSAVGLNNM